MMEEYVAKSFKWAFISLVLVVATNSFISLTEMIYPVENWNPWTKSLIVWTLLAVILAGVSTTFVALWYFAKAAFCKEDDKFEAIHEPLYSPKFAKEISEEVDKLRAKSLVNSRVSKAKPITESDICKNLGCLHESAEPDGYCLCCWIRDVSPEECESLQSNAPNTRPPEGRVISESYLTKDDVGTLCLYSKISKPDLTDSKSSDKMLDSDIENGDPK